MHLAQDKLIHQLFEDQAGRTPLATAVIAGQRRVSYRDLDRAANGIARRLTEAGVAPGDLVGLCLPRDERLVAALLGVFKAGGAYVALDPAYPADRLGFIVEDARLTHIVATRPLAALVGSSHAEVVAVEEAEQADDGPGVTVGPESAAYVVYTSGSTGRPKGLVIEHGNAANFLRWFVSSTEPAELAGCLAALSASFDGSTMEIFPPLLAGGTVILAQTLLELPTLAARDEVTSVVGPPSALRVLLRSGLPASVRTVCPVGEALPAALVRDLFALPGITRVRNGYGPTETTTLSHCHDMRADSYADQGAPPIGRLVAGAQGLVLDPLGHEVAEGGTGELWIAGPGVARGYLHRPELTAERFVADPAVAGGRRYRTGDLVRREGEVYHYAGRIDDQVKIRGFRVELGEVEAALAAHPSVAAAVATAPVDEAGGRTLLAYAVPAPGAAPTERELRDHLGSRLPGYLVPSRIGLIDAVPLNPNGKADRAALPALAPAQGRDVAGADRPRDEREAAVCAVFAQVLGVETVGVHDDFFSLGGHSLGAALAVAKITEALGTVTPLAWLLAGPTPAALAARIAAGGGEEPRPVRHTGRDTFPLTAMQSNLWQALRVSPESANTMGFELRLYGVSGARMVQAALDGILRRHEVLRSVLTPQGERPVLKVHPPLPMPLAEADLRGSADPAGEAAEIANAALSHVFDLSTEVPLIRATLIWTAADEARLIVVVDHIAFDGYSIGLFAEEIADGLAAFADGRPDPTPEPSLQFGDVGVLHQALAQRPALEGMREFWRGELAGANSPNLPRTPREKWPVHGRRIVHVPDADAVARLRSLEEACGVTRFTVFATALGVLLREATGISDNLLGAVTALRDRPGMDRLIGPMFDLVVIRIRVDEGITFRQLAAATSDARSHALANQEIGFRGIMMCNAGQQLSLQLAPVVLSMQPDSVPVALRRGGIRVELAGELDSGASPLGDLAVLVNMVAEGLQIHLMYDMARFEPAEIDAFLQGMLRVLDCAAADPDRAVTDYAPTPGVGTRAGAGAAPELEVVVG